MKLVKLLMLDKDGTLVKPASGSTFPMHPKDQQVLPGVTKALQSFVSAGWLPVIVSNQGRVAAGYKTIDDAIEEMRYCLELLPGITLALFCPDAGENCYRVTKTVSDRKWGYSDIYGSFRKPGAGMLNYAVAYQLPVTCGMTDWAEVKRQSLMVGDRPEDFQAAQAAGVPFLSAAEWRDGL